MQDDDLLQEVDEHDNPIGAVSRRESKVSGRRHRVVRVIVEDEAGNTLIQKRVATKDMYPNCWDNAAAGHVDVGESYLTAVERELQEEIGIEGVDLEEVCYYYSEAVSPTGQILNRFTKIYRTIVPHNTQFTLQPSEVSEVKWVTLDEVRSLVEEGTQISDGLLQAYEQYYQTTSRKRQVTQ